MRGFRRIDKHSMPLTADETGSRASGISTASDTRLNTSRQRTHESHTRPDTRNNFANRKAQESQVSVLWTCGTLRIISKKGGGISCDHDARFAREQLVSYVGNIVGTRGSGRREPFSCSLRRGGPIGKVLVPVVTEMSTTIVTRFY